MILIAYASKYGSTRGGRGADRPAIAEVREAG